MGARFFRERKNAVKTANTQNVQNQPRTRANIIGTQKLLIGTPLRHKALERW